VRESGRPSAEHLLVAATGLAAALPVIVSAIDAIANHWIPLGDDAVIAVRAYDVFSANTPLLGQYSAASGLSGGESHSLGPMLYWLLAIPVRLGGATGLVVAMCLLNTAAVMGSVALAHRRGGLGLAVGAGTGLALVCASLPPETIHSVWNPSAGQLPLVLLIFLCWSLACGEIRLLAVTAVVASFMLQCHLTYVLPGLGLLAVGLGGLALARAWERRQVIAAAIAGLVCWSFPLIEQASTWPGNLVATAAKGASGDPTLGPSAGLHAVGRAVGVPPWWLRGPQDPVARLGDVVSAPSVWQSLSALLVVGGLILVAAAGLRRGRRDVAAAGAIGLVLCAAVALVAASTPEEPGLVFTIAYTLRWASPAGMWIWLALGWSAAVLLAPRADLRAPVLVRPAAVVAVAVVAAMVAARLGPDLLERRYEPAAEVADEVRAQLTPGRPVSIEASLDAFDFQAALVYELRRRGEPVAAPSLAPQLGGQYGRDELAPERMVRMRHGSPEGGDGRLLARAPDNPQGGEPRPGDPDHVLSVTLAPVRPAR
jgi:hypothetical protein